MKATSNSPFPVSIGASQYAVMLVDIPADGQAYFIDHDRQIIVISTQADVPATIAQAVADAWGDAVRRYGAIVEAAWEHWSEVCQALDDINEEICEDDAGDAFSSFTRLLALGVRLDPDFIAGMEATIRHTMGINSKGSQVYCSESFVDDCSDDDSDDEHADREHPFYAGKTDCGDIYANGVVVGWRDHFGKDQEVKHV